MSLPTDTVPVPPGPGVQPPFVAAPIEGRASRRWLGLGLAGAVLAMCCGVGVVAVGGFFVTAVLSLNEQAEVAVGDYLDALADGDWERAYDARCDDDNEAESLAEFTRRVSAPPQVESYELGSFDMLELRQPAELTYQDGTTERETYQLAQDPRTGTLRVCERGS